MDRVPAAFREGLATLSAEQFAAFVAELWTERGRTVSRDGDVLRVTEPSGETRVLATLAAGEAGPLPSSVDVVVTADRSTPSVADEVELVDPAALYRLVRFGVSEAAGERLVETYVDPGLVERFAETTPPASAQSETPASSADAGEPSGSESPEPVDSNPPSDDPSNTRVPWSTQVGVRRRTVLVAGGAFVAGLATAAAIRSGRSTDAPSPPTAQRDLPSRRAPGLGADGVFDAERLATAHIARLQERSYTVRASKTIYDDAGRLRSSWAVRTAVDASRAFRAAVSTDGPDAPPLAGDPPASAVYWSDRETYLRRVTNATGTYASEFQPRRQINDWYFWSNIVPVGGLPYAAQEFYRDLFQVVSVDVRSGSGLKPSHRIVGGVETLDPPPLFLDAVDRQAPVTDVSLLGTVEDTGLVSALLLEYDGRIGDRPVDVTWTIEYVDLGATTVDRPAWDTDAVDSE